MNGGKKEGGREEDLAEYTCTMPMPLLPASP